VDAAAFRARRTVGGDAGEGSGPLRDSPRPGAHDGQHLMSAELQPNQRPLDDWVPANRSLNRKCARNSWRQRNPGGGVAVSTGTAKDVTGAVGGVVVVVVAPSVASGTAPTVPVPACMLATATPTAPTATTTPAPMTADNNLALF